MRYFQKILIFLLLFGSFSILPVAKADAVSIFPPQFHIGDEVIIQGEGFGELSPEYSAICFSDDKHCMLGDSTGILSWTDSGITLRAQYLTATQTDTTTVPSSGNIMVYAKKVSQSCSGPQCTTTTFSEKTATVPYTILPSILGVTNSDGIKISESYPGEIVTIIGYYFGNGAERVSFSATDGEIVQWTDTKITVKVPSPPRSMAKQAKLNVFRDLSVYGSYDFEVLSPLESADDQYSGAQTYLETTHIDELWDLIKPEKEVVVAVIDDGVYLNHEDLQGAFWTNIEEIAGNSVDDDQNGYIDDRRGWNFLNNSNDIDVLSSHGTSVAGIIAANKDNKLGVAGIASGKAKIMSLVVCDENGCPDNFIISAIRYAVDNGARVINLSLSGKKLTSYTTAYDDVIKYAWEKGVPVIAAAGNGDLLETGINTTDFPVSPVCNETESDMILGVGATTAENVRAKWSNSGKCADLFAPGEKIIGLTVSQGEGGGSYNFASGTSFSAPIISGVAAYILSAYPEMSNTELNSYFIKNTNVGIFDAKKLAEALKSGYDASKDTGNKWTGIKIFPPPEEISGEVSSKGKNEEVPSVFLDDIRDSEFKDGILNLRSKNIIQGYPDGTFKPRITINRAEFMRIVIGAIKIEIGGADCFSDVHDEWFAPYVCAAKQNYIISGYSDGTFQPSNSINVAEALKITLNAFKIWTREKSSPEEEWFLPYVDSAKTNNLYLHTFDDASQFIRREEMAEVISRILN
ncbi:S8 family serine peptidase [Candidatus Peregrinibacteria bacterium]|nr:S8 family serine peptidase [Candidatus Peregrinibacteria bacterium]